MTVMRNCSRIKKLAKAKFDNSLTAFSGRLGFKPPLLGRLYYVGTEPILSSLIVSFSIQLPAPVHHLR